MERNSTLNQLIRDINTLTTINLELNKIDADGARALASALEKNQTLTTINLIGNKIGDDGARALASALEKNQTLTTIYLRYNKIDGALERSI